jgi:hypothetical protein
MTRTPSAAQMRTSHLALIFQQENVMRIPTRFAPILFGALLSVIMVALVSAFVIATTPGVPRGLSGAMGEEQRHDLAGGVRGGDARCAVGAQGRRAADCLM